MCLGPKFELREWELQPTHELIEADLFFKVALINFIKKAIS